MRQPWSFVRLALAALTCRRSPSRNTQFRSARFDRLAIRADDAVRMATRFVPWTSAMRNPAMVADEIGATMWAMRRKDDTSSERVRSALTVCTVPVCVAGMTHLSAFVPADRVSNGRFSSRRSSSKTSPMPSRNPPNRGLATRQAPSAIRGKGVAPGPPFNRKSSATMREKRLGAA